MENVINSSTKKASLSPFDSKKAKINIIISVLLKVLLLISSFIARRALIRYIGNDANGLNSLYTSILGFLSVADLGIGTAIVYCMYEPIAKNDLSKVSQLYHLFKKTYAIIGIIVLTLGSLFCFFLPYLAKGYEADSSLYIGYILTLLNVVITYFFSAKLSLINAYKNNYISTTITSISTILVYLIQILVVFFVHSFILYCSIKCLSALFQCIALLFIHKYDDVIKNNEKIEPEVAKKVSSNVKALFLHKIGDVIFGTVDSLVISSVIGVVILGYYSNYLTILTAMNEIIKLFIISLTSVIGHMGVTATAEEKYRYFKFFYLINFILGIVFYLGYFSVCSDLVTIFFGNDLLLEPNLIMVMTITYFIQFIRQSCSVFKDSFGLFYKDRYVAIIAALINATLSIIFAFIFGIYGVLLATIIVDILIYHVIEPMILFRYGFEKKPLKYYLVNYSFILLFCLEVFLFSLVKLDLKSVWLHMLVSGTISICFNILPIVGVFMIPDFRRMVIRNFLRFK